MKKLTIISLFFSLFFLNGNVQSQNGWYQINTGANRYLSDIHFINENTGWCSGDSASILKTTNGGLSWTGSAVYSNPKMRFTFIRFADSMTGYAGGWIYDYLAYLQYRLLFKTTNQGQNWFLLRSVPDFEMQYYTSISIISPDTFYVAASGQYSLGGTFGFIEKTVNGGANYTMTTGPGYNSIWFINYLTGWASAYYADDIGQKKDFIFATTNGGVNWNLQYKDTVSSVSINRIQFVNQSTGYAIGGSYVITSGNPKFFKTVNGGTNWSKTDIPFYKIFSSLYFINPSTGWICGAWSTADSTTIARTTDGGATFRKQRKTAMNDAVASVFFINSMTGFAANSYNILKTTNGGTSFVKNVTTEIPSSFRLSQNYPNPFNPVTKIKFDIPLDSRFRGNDKVVLKVYDVMGRDVRTLVNEELQPGTYETTFDGSALNSGVYFVKMTAGDFSDIKKMVLIK